MASSSCTSVAQFVGGIESRKSNDLEEVRGGRRGSEVAVDLARIEEAVARALAEGRCDFESTHWTASISNAVSSVPDADESVTSP